MISRVIELEWKREHLLKGCILAAIAHAIMVAHYPDFSNEHSWDGINYSVQNSEGARGTITFHPQYCIGAFRDDNSDRSNKIKKATDYLKGAPKEIIEVAEIEALQYLLDSVKGKTIPLITSAFWSEGNNLYSSDTQDDMYEHGGFLLERQVMDINDSMEAWKEYYEMSEQQGELLELAFSRKIANPSVPIILSKKEISMIETDDEDNLNESRTSFGELYIKWEV
jgi:hypothetical protein